MSRAGSLQSRHGPLTQLLSAMHACACQHAWERPPDTLQVLRQAPAALQKLPVRVAALPTSTAVPVSALYLALAVWTLAQVCAIMPWQSSQHLPCSPSHLVCLARMGAGIKQHALQWRRETCPVSWWDVPGNVASSAG